MWSGFALSPRHAIVDEFESCQDRDGKAQVDFSFHYLTGNVIQSDALYRLYLCVVRFAVSEFAA